LQDFEDAAIVGEAENGAQAVEIIKETKPDLALLDLQMPEANGIDVVKLLRKSQMPLVAFVTAYDEYAVQAFEVNAIDYLLNRLKNRGCAKLSTGRANDLSRQIFRANEATKLKAAVAAYEENADAAPLERIPVRQRGEILLIPVSEIASIIADGELLHITNLENKKYTINFRLKDIEARLDAKKFVRLHAAQSSTPRQSRELLLCPAELI
jgi:DNA-binding LytR/AlgR family response regulator